MNIIINPIPAYNKGDKKNWIASIPGVKHGYGNTEKEAVHDLLGIPPKEKCINKIEYSVTSIKDEELYYENLFTYISDIFVNDSHYFIPVNLLDISEWDDEICAFMDYDLIDRYGIEFYKIGILNYNDKTYDVFYSEEFKNYL